ncbi:hypothetical protein Dthio_PD2903 [Desulfonatronospira thiodismutans ASO3-1]|uniref:Uncharacterized protein n=1 Tax=Desulfonatronospira thiodismutans ASO3-1 TaxID=555779 RepID=D6SLC0_9BACT|nr:hypothetical protein [Desulfonatronospira thiodismutans]EFI35481.1 hypothetical protein Dthio_PD2903 [Desulfonatronospira thiodismutans ASO3-1]
MPGIARFVRDNQPTVYHIISRTALQGLPIKDKRGQGSVSRGIDQKVVEKAGKKGYKISRVERFRYRCRYFTRLNRPKVYGSAVFNRVNPVKHPALTLIFSALS